MKATYTDHGRPWPEGAHALEQATGWLEEAIGSPSDRVTAVWDRTTDDKGRTLFDLRISDWTGAANARFEPNELQSPTHMRVRLYRLWGDLLQARDHQELRKLHETGGTET
jgi:hypothetical protein